MKPINELADFVMGATIPYRKGAEVEEKEVGNFKIVTVNGYPETPSHGMLIDVHFLQIGFTEAAAIDKNEFLAMIVKAEHGEFCDMPLTQLAGGPSYITTGGWLGSQDVALRFIALGAHLGLWGVVTPAMLGIEGEDADRMAGMGFVMNGGLRNEPGGEANAEEAGL